MAARKSTRKRPEPVQVSLDLDFGQPPPALTVGPSSGAGPGVTGQLPSVGLVSPVTTSVVAASSLVPPAGGAYIAGMRVAEYDANPAAQPGFSSRSGNEAGPPVAEASPVVLTVTQLTKKIRRLLELQYGHVWVEGELSNVRRQPNGHAYFTLKDGGAQLTCVLFRGQAHAGMPMPEDGLHVQLGGEITVYEPRGQYQLIVQEMQVAGMGVLQAKFEALKRRLAAEGLFDAGRKRRLPEFPTCVALVTSPTGAAVRDILTVLARRAPWVQVLIVPVRVQGDGAATEIATAIRRLGDYASLGLPRPDVVIVGRGGGSMEDLWCFNDEAVARALAESPIPTISAVGHEIDFTIADFAADVRALTPSAAAELAVPDGADLRRRLLSLRRAMVAHASEGVRHARTVVDFHRRSGLARELRRILAQCAQQVDGLAESLRRAADDRLRLQKERLERLGHRLAAQRPGHVLAQRAQVLTHLATRLSAAQARQSQAAEARMQRAADMLRSLGPQAVLSRGYTMTLAPNGQALTRATQVRPGDRLTTRLADGTIESLVTTPRLPPAGGSPGGRPSRSGRPPR